MEKAKLKSYQNRGILLLRHGPGMLGTHILFLPKEWPSMIPAETSTIRSVGVTGKLQKASCKSEWFWLWLGLTRALLVL